MEMPRLSVDGKSIEVEKGKRLVLAIEEAGVAVGHRCGGNARCTTCRVEFVSGEPDTMTRAEYDKLTERGLIGQARLSCQIICNADMSVRVVMSADNQPQWKCDTGPDPEIHVTPEAEFLPVATLKNEIKTTDTVE
jgi:ferredoxin